MQNNGLIRLFAILFGLVSIYQLSFTFITSQKESQAKAFASAQYAEDVEDYIELRDRAVVDYLDSIGNAPIFGFTSYNDAKGKELNKGLDLKGGINVILQISVKDILKGLAENSKTRYSTRRWIKPMFCRSVATILHRIFFHCIRIRKRRLAIGYTRYFCQPHAE